MKKVPKQSGSNKALQKTSKRGMSGTYDTMILCETAVRLAGIQLENTKLHDVDVFMFNVLCRTKKSAAEKTSLQMECS